MMGAYKSRLAQVIHDATAVCYHPPLWYMKIAHYRQRMDYALGLIWAVSMVVFIIMAFSAGWWSLIPLTPVCAVWAYTIRMNRLDKRMHAMQEAVVQYVAEEYGTRYKWEEIADMVQVVWITQVTGNGK
ncbi:MAG: hypothetical protein ACK5XQ_01620 [Flavobacteriales bacterium]|jgi:hypothetical protein